MGESVCGVYVMCVIVCGGKQGRDIRGKSSPKLKLLNLNVLYGGKKS